MRARINLGESEAVLEGLRLGRLGVRDLRAGDGGDRTFGHTDRLLALLRVETGFGCAGSLLERLLGLLAPRVLRACLESILKLSIVIHLRDLRAGDGGGRTFGHSDRLLALLRVETGFGCAGSLL